MKAATGEEVTAEELGGGDVHTRISGVADHLAEDDAHALEIARSIVANLGGDAKPLPRRPRRARGAAPTIRRRSTASCPRDLRTALRRARGHRAPGRRLALPRVQGALRHDARLRLRADLHGFPSAILANNGILFSERALKAHALHRAVLPAPQIPLLFLQNITGFMVGKQYEQGGIAKDGAKMVHAVANAAVPEVHGHHRRHASAPGNYGMCGRAYGPRFLWMWPNARISRDGRRAGGLGARARSSRTQLERTGKPG